MIHIERLPKPNILLEKEQEWTDKFINSGKTRPDNTKYGHKTILETLQSMSFTKCFYCEQKLKGVTSEIDHLIEVNIDKTQAYSWDNLYLSCENCNHKINHLSISIHDVLIPCKDNDKEIQQHLTYNDEQITALNHSPKGLKTIQKFKLDTERLDYLRMCALKKFHTILLQIHQRQIKDGGSPMTPYEKEILCRFAQKDQAFSLMFSVILSKIAFK